VQQEARAGDVSASRERIRRSKRFGYRDTHRRTKNVRTALAHVRTAENTSGTKMFERRSQSYCNSGFPGIAYVGSDQFSSDQFR
jgi:hypothetical protein